METYIDMYINVDGEKISKIHSTLLELNVKPTIGDHDYVYDWKGIVTIEEELRFIERIQEKLKGSGAILRFHTIR